MLVLVLVTACGCSNFTFSPQELYSLPKLPAEYAELDKRIHDILAGGAEYAAPTTGTNIQSVQLVDLDGDGAQEAVAFFRNAAEEKPLQICIFAAHEETYEQLAVIEGSGTGISSIEYSDLNGDGSVELVVGWRVSMDLQALSVYSLRSGEPVELMGTNYVRYAFTDLDQDGIQELAVLRSDNTGAGAADYYGWYDGSLVTRSTARISMTMAELSQQGDVHSGTLQDGVPALFVTGVEGSNRAITDILTLKDGELTNIVLSDTTGVSTEIAPFRALYPTDINSDGVTEVPRLVMRAAWDGQEETYQRVDWQAYDSDGHASLVLSTYHAFEDGWYLRLPETWRDRVLAARSTTTDEASVTFYIEEEGLQPFLRITAITGSGRDIRAVRSGRFTLSRQSKVNYTAELLEKNSSWEHSVTEDELRSAFSLTTKDWVRETR